MILRIFYHKKGILTLYFFDGYVKIGTVAATKSYRIGAINN